MEFFMFMMLLLSIIMSAKVLIGKENIYLQWEIFTNLVNVDWVMIFDQYSLMFMSMVLFISLIVMIYSNEYMVKSLKFKFLILWFVTTMILLIFSPSLFSMILGWDGLGLSSYCLVIYYQNSKSNSAGMITILSNRIGDVIILFLIGVLSYQNTFDFLFLTWNSFTLFLIILISITKSAQIPFSAWLPAAMAAPTPVSSLVHSSTLVTAGVYLVFRFNDLMCPMKELLMFLGTLTMIYAGLNGCFEMDMKKVIALSTLSQLGMMFFGLGLMISNWVYIHLMIHALFKSLMFLCAGVMIHSSKSSQDFRIMSNYMSNSPYISSLFMFSIFSLCGLPFLGGFFSKDLLIELFFSSYLSMINIIMYLIGITLTVMYSFRFCLNLMSLECSTLTFMNYKYNYQFRFTLLILFLMNIMISYFLYKYNYMFKYLSYPSFEEKYLAIILLLMMLILLFFNFNKINKRLYMLFLDLMGLSKMSSWLSNIILNYSLFLVKNIDSYWLELSGPLNMKKYYQNEFLLNFMKYNSKIFMMYFFVVLLMMMMY